MAFPRKLRRRLSRTSLRVPVVWLRHRGLNGTDTFIASYPRSGSTWLRFLLFEILTRDSAGFEGVNRLIPDVGRHRRGLSLLPDRGRLIKTHEVYRDVYQRAVYLARDVRDVIISEYEYEKASDRISEDFDTFVMLSLRGKVNGYGPWQDHLISWLDSPLAHSGRLLVVKFEDLRHQTEDTMADILNFLGVKRDRQAIREAIANNSVQRMRGKEDRSPQIDGAPRAQAAGESNRFIRSGSVGGWRTRLTEAQIRLIERHAGPGLARMGYPIESVAVPVGSCAG